jgi:uncharacterized RDD family membrane protein YckC
MQPPRLPVVDVAAAPFAVGGVILVPIATDEGTARMSQDSPPPPGPDEGQPPEPHAGAHPGAHAGPPPPEQPAYNPYPDNWNDAPRGNPAFNVEAPPSASGNPYGTANPYGAPAPPAGPVDPYGAPAPPGGPVNPYAGTNPERPTFGFGGYAGWFTRVGAALIDGLAASVALIPAIAGVVVLAANTTTTTNPDGTTTSSYSGSLGLPVLLILIGGVAYLAFFVWNVCIRQGRTGATLGKSVLAIRLVNSDGQPIGPGWAFLRYLLHTLDGFCYLGYLWPIWDSRKQTFADKIMNTFVIQATTPQERPFR